MGVYELLYNPDCPVVCMDEKPINRWVMQGNQCKCVPAPMKIDFEYFRNGTCSIFAF